MRREHRAGWAFSAPVLLTIGLLFALPSALALVLSLTDFDLYAVADPGNLRWIGAGNYAGLAHNPLFWRALRNTLLLTALGTPAAIAASLGAALLLDRPHLRARAVWRVMLFAPYVMTLVATAIAWRTVLGTRFGLANRLVEALGLPPVDWLGDPHISMPTIVLFVTWKQFGYNMLIFAAALGTVPRDLLDAARLDGAGALTRLRHVTLPAIAPVLLLATLLTVVGLLQVFAEPYIMTQGGPAQSTETLLYYMFEEAFNWWNLGVASAVAAIVFALTLTVSGAQVRLGRRLGWF